MSPFSLTYCVCVMVTKYSPSPSLNCKLSFVWRKILISFRGKSHSGHSGGASLGISRMESLICRNSSQLKFNRTIVNSGTASGKVGARTEQQNLSEKLNRTESWDRLHTLRLHNQSFCHRRKRAKDMSHHLLLGGAAKHWSLVGGWLVGSSHLTHGGWQSTGKLTHRRTVTDPLHARSSPRTRTWASSLTTQIRKLLTKRKYRWYWSSSTWY